MIYIIKLSIFKVDLFLQSNYLLSLFLIPNVSQFSQKYLFMAKHWYLTAMTFVWQVSTDTSLWGRIEAHLSLIFESIVHTILSNLVFYRRGKVKSQSFYFNNFVVFVTGKSSLTGNHYSLSICFLVKTVLIIKSIRSKPLAVLK